MREAVLIVLFAGVVCAADAARVAQMDKTIEDALQKYHASGAAVAIVLPGEAPIVRGYGLADPATGRKVDAEKTAFRTGSVSKIYCAMAVMQLVKEGKLDLNADVNRYLDFAVPPYDGKPVTLANLLTHTGGFDDRYIGKSARSFETAKPLGQFLREFLPERVMPPGEIYTYSNSGVALAGYIAERAAGKPFAQYVDEIVFQPLGMRWSAFLLPDRIREYAARPTVWTGSNYRLLPWDYIQDAPAGMQMMSAADAALFIQWALANLSRDEMQMHFRNHPQLKWGIGWGWHFDESHGYDRIGHAGGYAGVGAKLAVLPEQKAGYFYAVNTSSYMAFNSIGDAIHAAFLPKRDRPSPTKLARIEGDVAKFAGTYRNTRHSRGSLTKVGLLMGMGGGEIVIGDAGGGVLTMPKMGSGLHRLVMVGPRLFESQDEDYRCAFREDARGRVTHLFTDGTSSFERVPWYFTLGVQRWVFVVTAAIIFLFSFGWIRRRTLPESLRRSAACACGVLLVHSLGLGLVFQVLTPAEEAELGFAYGLHWLIWPVQVLSVIGVGCAAWYLAAMIGKREFGRLALVAGAAFVGYALWLWEWRLLGFWF